MPSRLVGANGMQPHMVVYMSAATTGKHKRQVMATFPRYYINLNESLYVRLRVRRVEMLEENPQCTFRVKVRAGKWAPPRYACRTGAARTATCTNG